MNDKELNNLWTYLNSLDLTASNREWLADRLYNDIEEEEIGCVQTEHTSN